jgi:hypothetical protein
MSADHPDGGGAASVLILTPVKNATAFLDRYFDGLATLTYDPSLLSLGLLDSDSDDETFGQFGARLARSCGHYASTSIWQRNFGYRMPPGHPRWTHAFQLPRRKILAKARNHLLFRALDAQDWVLWLDVDVIEYPADLIERLLAVGRDIVHPHCVLRHGGPTFDRNAWRDHGRVHMDQQRGGPELVRLDSVGGTVLLVRADVHRDGLIFPPFPYGAASPRVRRPGPFGAGIEGELETEGLGIMAADMGRQCWGLPNLEVLHASEDATPRGTANTIQPGQQENFRLLAAEFAIRTNSAALLDRLRTRMPQAEQDVPVTLREVLDVTWTGTQFRIAGGGEEDFELSLSSMRDRLTARMQRRAIEALPDHIAIRAACGAHAGRSFLLVGPKGSGKTTLALRLLLDGFAMSGDALVLLRDGAAVAVPRKFMLGEAGVAPIAKLAAMPQYRAAAQRPRAGRVVPLDPPSFGMPWRIAPAPVSAIFFLDANHGSRSIVRGCAKADLARRVMPLCAAPVTGRRVWVADLIATIDRAATYVVDFGDLDDAVAGIADALAGSVVPRA